MTDLVTPGEAGSEVDNTSAGYAWSKAGTGAWIVDGFDIAGLYSAIDETALNGFAYETSSGLTVTIGAGEAYVAGWLVRDRTTDVDLPADSSTTVYVGYDASAVLSDGQSPADNENVILGTESAFAPEDPRVALFTIDTGSSTVTNHYDLRLLQQPIQYDSEAGSVTVVPSVTLSDTDINGSLSVDDAISLSHVSSAGAGADFVSGEPLIDLRRHSGYSDRGVHITFGNEDKEFHIFGSETALAIYNDNEERIAAWDQAGNLTVNDVEAGNVQGDSFDATGGGMRNLNELDQDAVSSPDAPKIYVSSTEPDDTDPHLWFIPE